MGGNYRASTLHLFNTATWQRPYARSKVDWKRSHSGFSRKEVQDVLRRRRSINRSWDHCARAQLPIDRDHPDHSWSARRRFRLLRQPAGAIEGEPFTNSSTASGCPRSSFFLGPLPFVARLCALPCEG